MEFFQLQTQKGRIYTLTLLYYIVSRQIDNHLFVFILKLIVLNQSLEAGVGSQFLLLKIFYVFQTITTLQCDVQIKFFVTFKIICMPLLCVCTCACVHICTGVHMLTGQGYQVVHHVNNCCFSRFIYKGKGLSLS